MKRTNIKRIIGLIILVIYITACGPATPAPTATLPPTETPVPKPPIGGQVLFSLTDGEFSNSGILVQLFDNALLAAKADNPIIATAQTDASGRYSFQDVKPGEYSLAVEVLDFNQLISSFPTSNPNCSKNQAMTHDGEFTWLWLETKAEDGTEGVTAMMINSFEWKENDLIEINLTLNCKP